MHAGLVITDFHFYFHFILIIFIFLHRNEDPHAKKGCDEAVKLLHHTLFSFIPARFNLKGFLLHNHIIISIFQNIIVFIRY